MDDPEAIEAPYQGVTGPLPRIPEDVRFERGVFTNAGGLRLQTYSFWRKQSAEPPKAVVYLAHGYADHTLFAWMRPPKTGDAHSQYEGSVVDELVDAGYACVTLDHQSFGRSEGARGLRGFFERFDDLPREANDFVESTTVSAMGSFQGLPCFALGHSMGGCTAVRMAQLRPDLYKGVVLVSPMISLERVKEEAVCLCVKNRHLESVSDFVSSALPTLPIAAPARNEIHPLAQKEFDDDPLIYHGAVRARVAAEFLEVTTALCSGGAAELKTAFLTIHSESDGFTDPAGSQILMDSAAAEDKTYLKVGDGLDVDAEMFHALLTEPSCELVIARILAWLQEHS